MSRRVMDCAAVPALCFLLSLATTEAFAGPPHPGGGGGGAPAPHFSAPAPHFSAPAHIAAPRTFAAPPRNFAARPAPPPHFAARPAPHIATPQRSFARMPTGHPAQAQQFAGPSHHETVARTARELNRHAATPPPNITKNAAVNAKTAPTVSKGQPVTGTKEGEGQTANLKGQAVTGAKTGETANLKGQRNLKGESNLLQGQNQNVLNRQNAPQQKMALAEAAKARVAEAKKTPILKNPVFASTSPRAMGTTLSNWTFRGHFAQSAFFRDRDRFHHRHLGIVLGFIGVVFWPYAYDDFVDYTFAPYAYDTFWPYAYDDVYAGIFGDYAPEYYAPEDAYAYAGSQAWERAYTRAETARAGGERFPG